MKSFPHLLLVSEAEYVEEWIFDWRLFENERLYKIFWCLLKFPDILKFPDFAENSSPEGEEKWKEKRRK